MSKYEPLRFKKTARGLEVYTGRGRRRGVLVRRGVIAETIYSNFETAIKLANLIERAPRGLHTKLKRAISTVAPGVLISLYDVGLVRGPTRGGAQAVGAQATSTIAARRYQGIRESWERGNPSTEGPWRSQKELARALATRRT